MIKPGYAHWADFCHGAVSIFSGSHSRRPWSKVRATAAVCRCCAARWLPLRLTAIDFSKLWFWQLELGYFPTMGKRKKKNWSLVALMGLPVLPSVAAEWLQASSAKPNNRSWVSYRLPPALGQTLSGSSSAFFIPMTSRCTWVQFKEEALHPQFVFAHTCIPR